MSKDFNFRSQDESFIQDPPGRRPRTRAYVLRELKQNSPNAVECAERAEVRMILRSSGRRNTQLSFVDDLTPTPRSQDTSKNFTANDDNVLVLPEQNKKQEAKGEVNIKKMIAKIYLIMKNVFL